ncbi:hypothetical protein, partial [Paraburkholderia sp. Ac-20347]|uniref:hypothetical protein n=1 Tax=Paraburkholderia sp. Ac-20347 TaxID=2703892 RepID=UPI00197F5707
RGVEYEERGWVYTIINAAGVHRTGVRCCVNEDVGVIGKQRTITEAEANYSENGEGIGIVWCIVRGKDKAECW